ncbi:xyloglucan:xyloglucosyl transferase [Marchantia polymorpha subsp. ruderalis]|uniref:Xyloglucan endotransglucosylase/hydrolase n=2 Tax=Marchantia polymorpha TaxID=3197 RepID=A0AAF6B4Y2_MARPO|nr:hypothetical protein MARPO_0066s0072 [Marchantia polymorpha]BBN07066.1 hypothetical protein Mp_4g00700 [Marchantia polymorpha subsp. ruderalis]|eukprot:PTQ36118.1 hypothetical protein MARPO_0066s0072 [Marchantia polymorpha]
MKMILSLFCFTAFLFSGAQAAKFANDFNVTWGKQNVNITGSSRGDVVTLTMTKEKGGAGFRSLSPFLYGHFSMKMKLIKGNSSGTITAFYMSSQDNYKKWCEIDFEFLGNVSGQPYTLQTNVYIQGVGNREQQIYLWFDPTAAHHTYRFLWNQELIMFFVDNRAIRVFHKATDLGIPYLDYQPMYAIGSLWNGEAWATEGGRIKTDWTQQPFVASYTQWNVSDSCQVQNSTGTAGQHACYEKAHKSSYGQAPNLALTKTQIKYLRWVRKNYVIYDYCTKNATATPECTRNWP